VDLLSKVLSFISAKNSLFLQKKKLMRFTIILILFGFISCTSNQESKFEQNNLEYNIPVVQKDSSFAKRPFEEHIQALRDFSVKVTEKGESCSEIQDSFFVDHIINTKLSNPEFKKYISFKPWLEPITPRIGDVQGMLLADSTSNGDEYRIELLVTDFDSSAHKIEMEDENTISSIDGMEPFGAKSFINKYPSKRIDYIKVIYNGKEFLAPPNCSKKFYDPKISSFRLPQTMAEAYVNGDYLYVYFFGGKGPNAYMAKLIFLKGQYIMSIVAEYNDIGCFGLFKQQNNYWY
jgi:hypothetical protein